MDHIHDSHNYACQHLKLVCDRVKTHYGILANCVGYHEDNAWLYWPTRMKGKSPKLQSPWEGPYEVVTQINDVVYKIQQNPRTKMMVAHLDQLAPY
jgi:hypothetical protein